MLRLPVESSDLVSVGYDSKSRILEIEFKEGRIYQYHDVAPDVYERFMRTDSYGEFFFSNISKRYRYTRVDETSGQDQGTSHTAVALVSGNADKLRHARAACDLFDIHLEQLELPVDEIQSHDAEKIALHKAKQAYRLANRPVLVQDSYWNIIALRGFPGAYMHDVSAWFKPEDFLKLMEDKPDRTAVCTHTVVYYDGKHAKTFSKDFIRQISQEARGQGTTVEQVVIGHGGKTLAEIREAGELAIPVEHSVWHDFAKWYNLQRKLKKV